MDDFYSDDGTAFAKFLTDYELPDFVRDGEANEPEKLAGLPDDAFADPTGRRFPIHDRANTFISAAYCMTQPEEKQAKAVLEVISKRAELLGIGETLVPLATHLDGLINPPTPKVASAGTAFEIHIGGAVDKLRGHGKRAACSVQDWFIRNLQEVPFENRSKVAVQVLDVLKANDVAPQEDVMKIAGLAECDFELLHQQYMLRLSITPGGVNKTADFPTAQELGEDPVAPLSQHVQDLNEIDKKHKLARYYGERLLDPHRATYNTVKKVAETIQVGPKSWPLSQWAGPTIEFQDQLKAALGEKAGTLFRDGQPDREKLAALSAGEVGLIERYVS